MFIFTCLPRQFDRGIRRANNKGLVHYPCGWPGGPIIAMHAIMHRGPYGARFAASALLQSGIIAASRTETSRKFHALNSPGARD